MLLKKDGFDVMNNNPQEPVDPEIKEGHRDAVVSFTLGMLSIFCSPFFGVPGLILAWFGLKTSRKAQKTLPLVQRDVARMGFSMCVIGIIFSLFQMAFWFLILTEVVYPVHLFR